MRQVKMYVPREVGEVLDQLGYMMLSAPNFLDKTGYFPYRNLDYVCRQLTVGLTNIRSTIGEDRYNDLTRMAAEMRALFEADPENTTGETLQGRKLILQMEDILREARRKA